MSKRISSFLPVLLWFGGCILSAQTGAASLRGLVRDASSAVIPRAEVTALHAGTGAKHTAIANDAGLYVFPSLLPGRYTLETRSAGMQPWSGQLVLQTGQSASLNIELQVASTATAITVVGDVTALVTTSNATLGTTIEQERVEQLPLDGRSLSTLIQITTPGAELGGGSGAIRIYGMAEGSMEYVQDGATTADFRRGGGYARMPGLDTVEEFRMETNNASAKSNRPAKAIIKTKSGTNTLHGALFETARNNGLGLARAREDFYTKAPPLIRNEFGASGGGPVVLPKIYNGRNRTFFFMAYERYARRQYNTASSALPTAEMEQGDFSGLIDGAGRRYTLYDPYSSAAGWSRTPFPNNRIPLTMRSPMAEYMFKIMPEPTLAGINPLVADNYFAPAPSNRDDHTGTLRVDHRLSDNDQVFVRYTQSTALQTFKNNASAPVALDRSTNIRLLDTPNRTIAASWTRMFSPTFFSETTVNRANELRTNLTGDQTKDYAALLGLPNPFNRLGFPELNNVGLDIGTGESNQSFIDGTRILTVQQNMTKVWKRHEVDFGGSYRYNWADIRPQEQYVRGMHQFSSLATSLYDSRSGSRYAAVARTGHEIANFFLGVPGLSRVNKTRPWFHFQGPEYAGYLQDNFKVSSRLTLNLGVRFESFPIMAERDNLMTSFDRKTMSIVVGQPLDRLYAMDVINPAVIQAYTRLGVKFTTPQQAGMPDETIYTDRVNVLPRLGFAYRLTSAQKAIVLRGGYSRFAYPVPVGGYYARARSNAPLNVNYTINMNNAAESPDGLPNYLLRNAPVYVVGKNARNMISADKPVIGNVGSIGASYYDPYQPVTKIDQWNVTLEREIISNTVLRLSLLGNHGFDLDQMYNYNDPMSDYIWFVKTGLPLPTGERAGVARRPYSSEPYGNLEVQLKTGKSNFHGFQVEFERRFSRGVGFQFFYLRSKAWRMGGNSWRDDFMKDPWLYLDGAVPQDFDERNKFLNSHLDSEIPRHRVRWNWLVDLPFGRGKRFARSAGPVLNRIAGGWQLAGTGNLNSRWWEMPADSWGYLSEPQFYGTKYPVEDCRSGQCVRGYLYFNGYLPANRINSYDASGKPNGVMGVPADYKAAFAPIRPIPPDGGNPNDPEYQYLGSNIVFVKLKNGTQQPVGYDSGLHPWRNQWRLGPMNWSVDASLYKMVPITEQLKLRFNADFFNVLNMPGMPMPGASSGLISMRNSVDDPRVLQLTLRLLW
ncbi:MAG: carboxypeptidase regulatory-like domain-containing protein [Bryobacteraceae bacterium]